MSDTTTPAAVTVVPTAVVRTVKAVLAAQTRSGGPSGGAWVLVGPKGSGRRTGALMALRGLPEQAQSRVLDLGDAAMTTAQARQAVTHMRSRGVRIVLGRLDGAHHNVANILLKSIEERGPGKLWVLTARPGEVLPTIASRTTVVRTPLLADEELHAILRARRISVPEADALVRMAPGSVTEAMAARPESFAFTTVVTLLRGLNEGDLKAVSTSLRGWGGGEAAALRRWAVESASGMFSSFESLLYAAPHASAFAAGVLKGPWPSRIRVRALAWEAVAAHRASRGVTL